MPISKYTPTILPTDTIGLDLEPLIINVYVDNIPSFLDDNPAYISGFLAQLEKKFPVEYKKRRAGLVIALGYHSSGNIYLARRLAIHAIDVLQSYYPNMFSSVVEKTYWWEPDVNNPVGTIKFEIYFFRNNP